MLARKIILGFGFAVLLPLLIHYGIDVFVPELTSWDQHNISSRYYGEQQRLRDTRDHAATPEERTRAQARLDRLEEQHDEDEQRFEAEKRASSRTNFFIGAPIGIVVTLLGSFIRVQAVGGGLMLGGIFTFIEGCFWYWTDLPRVGRFVVLLIAFAVLLWIGYQRLSELKQPAKPS